MTAFAQCGHLALAGHCPCTCPSTHASIHPGPQGTQLTPLPQLYRPLYRLEVDTGVVLPPGQVGTGENVPSSQGSSLSGLFSEAQARRGDGEGGEAIPGAGDSVCKPSVVRKTSHAWGVTHSSTRSMLNGHVKVHMSQTNSSTSPRLLHPSVLLKWGGVNGTPLFAKVPCIGFGAGFVGWQMLSQQETSVHKMRTPLNMPARCAHAPQEGTPAETDRLDSM